MRCKRQSRSLDVRGRAAARAPQLAGQGLYCSDWRGRLLTTSVFLRASFGAPDDRQRALKAPGLNEL
eukprot:1246229-Pyramimonas_sp.AAC.1